MSASPAPSPAGRVRRMFSVPEWFTLRRYPLPEFHDSVRKLPASLLSLAEQALPSGQEVKGLLLLPAEYYSRKMLVWEYVPERALLFLKGDAALYIAAEAPGLPARTVLLDARSLLYVRSSLLLLYGLLEFKADCGSGSDEVRLEYNTVIWHALRGPLAGFVGAAAGSASRYDTTATNEAEVQAANAQILNSLPFKFANGLRYCALGPGERLHAAVFQPAMWERRIIPQQINPHTLLALTDRNVVIIEEKKSTVWQGRRSQGEYGWIFTYIPRDRVVDMTIADGRRWAELTMRLEWGAAREVRAFRLEPELAHRWQEHCIRYGEA